MSHKRELDSWPEPKGNGGLKLVVLSCSRTGTLGLYQALNILGYRPYHMIEVCAVRGTSHMKVLEDAVIAHNNRFSGIKRYDRKDFDKWLDGYDVLIELASYLGSEVMDAYLDDPDVKFILTEREPHSWIRSFNRFVCDTVLAHCNSGLGPIAKFWNPWLYHFVRLNHVMYNTFADSVPHKAPGNVEALRRNYVEYIDLVKRTIPPERLCVIKLEEGLGWEQICPYLEKEIPDVPYPEGRNHNEDIQNLLVPIIRNATMKMLATVVPVIGVGAWFLMSKGPAIMSKFRST